MKDVFLEFYELLKLDREKSSFSKNHSLEDRFKELKLEIDEIGEAIKNNDSNNLREELGDSLLDLFFMIVIVEEKGLFNGKNVIEDVIKKMKRRKPWIFENGEMKSIDEEIRLWNENKIKEKKNLI